MAEKPLRLKREKPSGVQRSSRFVGIAEVLLETDILHLDKTFSYGIPSHLRDVEINRRFVKVPFRDKEVDGFVLSVDHSKVAVVKPISRVLPKSQLEPQILDFATEVAKRYGTSLMAILRFMQQPLAPTSNSGRTPFEPATFDRKVKRRFIFETSNTWSQVISHLSKIAHPILIIVPTERELEAFSENLAALFPKRIIRLGATKKPVYETSEIPIYIGTRSSIFTSNSDIREYIVFHEQSEHYWERKKPFWNLRDVALIRSHVTGASITFVGGIPSLELQRLGSLGYLEIIRPKRSIRKRKIYFLPDTYHGVVREGLKNGVVLLSVAQRNYSRSFICKRCRMRASCECGFPFKLVSGTEAQCTICGKQKKVWQCNECSSVDWILLTKGIDRIKEEAGKAFPGTAVYSISSNQSLASAPKAGILIATPGVEMRAISYSAVVLFDGELRANRPSLRSEEHLLNDWLRVIALSHENAPIFVSLPRAHRISQALIGRDPMAFGEQLLLERRNSKLPPWFRIIRISGSQVASLAERFKVEFPQIEISRLGRGQELIIRVPIESAQSLVEAIYALQKYRFAKGQSSFDVEIDPFDI